jgi:hypothetical protein
LSVVEAILQRLFPPRVEPLGQAVRGRHVVVCGRVVPRDLMDSPLAREACVYYHYVVETWSPSTGTWLVVEQDEAIAEFYLQDDSGRVVVSPHDARVEVGMTVRPDVEPLREGTRARELRIRPGDTVEIHGVLEEAEDLLDETRGYREDMLRLAIRAVTGGQLKIRLLAR